MDTFTFTPTTGPVSVHFYPELTVPPIPVSGGMYVVDTNTAPLLRAAKGYAEHAPVIVIEAGESHKTLLNIEKILTAAFDAGLARDSLFVGFGGGVITDMTAFAASLFMRGARVELVPTTLLAMADAAIGGKTGIDFKGLKNSVGTFYPAQAIHISVSALRTLDRREFLSGLAEVVKTGLLYAPKLFHILQTRHDEILNGNEELLLEIVKRCVQAKARVVERDLRESGERMFLNLGHTFGHALESVAGFGSVTHGEAVAWGIGRAIELGIRLGITESEYKQDVFPTLEAYGWCTSAIHPSLKDVSDVGNTLLQAMKGDKKKRGGTIRFVLQREINSTLVTEVPDGEVLAVLS